MLKAKGKHHLHSPVPASRLNPTFMLSGTWQIVSSGRATNKRCQLTSWIPGSRTATPSTSADADQYLASGEDLCQLIWLPARSSSISMPHLDILIWMRGSQCRQEFTILFLRKVENLVCCSFDVRSRIIPLDFPGVFQVDLCEGQQKFAFAFLARGIKHIKVPFMAAIKVKSIRLLCPPRPKVLTLE